MTRAGLATGPRGPQQCHRAGHWALKTFPARPWDPGPQSVSREQGSPWVASGRRGGGGIRGTAEGPSLSSTFYLLEHGNGGEGEGQLLDTNSPQPPACPHHQEPSHGPAKSQGQERAWRINTSPRGQPAGPLEPRTAGGCKQSLLSWLPTLAHLSALGISTLPAIKKGQAGVGRGPWAGKLGWPGASTSTLEAWKFPPFPSRQREMNEWAALRMPEAQPRRRCQPQAGEGRGPSPRAPRLGQGRHMFIQHPKPHWGIQLGLGKAGGPWAANAQIPHLWKETKTPASTAQGLRGGASELGPV